MFMYRYVFIIAGHRCMIGIHVTVPERQPVYSYPAKKKRVIPVSVCYDMIEAEIFQ